MCVCLQHAVLHLEPSRAGCSCAGLALPLSGLRVVFCRIPVGTPQLTAELSCFLNNLSELRNLTTFYLAKNDHRWVIFMISFISLKAPHEAFDAQVDG